MSHACPHPACDEQVPRSRLCCRGHWYALPAPLRAAINSTWRNRKRDGLYPWSANVLEARRLFALADQPDAPSAPGQPNPGVTAADPRGGEPHQPGRSSGSGRCITSTGA